jgi:hypothetical protein
MATIGNECLEFARQCGNDMAFLCVAKSATLRKSKTLNGPYFSKGISIQQNFAFKRGRQLSMISRLAMGDPKIQFFGIVDNKYQTKAHVLIGP